MTEGDLKLRLREFALRVLRLCDAMPSSLSGRAIVGQLVRSGTSPGANYRAACRGRSLADFIAKLAIAEEEMDESEYWLDLVVARRYIPPQRVIPLQKEADELTRILTSSRLTASNNLQRERRATQIKNQKSKIKNPEAPVRA